MKAELNQTFAKLMNPRMNAGLVMLHTLLAPLQGDPVEPSAVRENVDKIVKEREVSKQSISNVAGRLEASNIIERTRGYSVNYGYLISMLLHKMIEMSKRMNDLEEEILNLKDLLSPPA
ncbi:MAG: MarR family transcriptional regulator [Candidatus Thorarchaeota archaeon]